jgi:hypothetical protein
MSWRQPGARATLAPVRRPATGRLNSGVRPRMKLYSELTDKAELNVHLASLAGKLTRGIFEDIESELEEYCRLVPPVIAHYPVFSPRLLGIILRSAAEIDSQLNAIASNAGLTGKRTVMDHIAMEPRLQLSQYAVAVKFSGELIRPFESFAQGNSPDWWKVYGKIKHDRFSAVTSATLGNSLSAVAGLYVLLHRQFGALMFPAPMALREDGRQIAVIGTRLFRLEQRPGP